MPLISEITLPADLAHLQAFLEQADHWAREAGLSEKKVQDIALATEEALVNIFHYGYREGEGEVAMACRIAPETLTLEIRDTGQPFNPLSREDPDTSLSLEDRPIGGLGIFLIKQLMDEVHYRREGDQNILTVVIRRK
jgi:serine/threonine-protein kinase RsbW